MEHSPSNADSRSADDELALCVQNSPSVNPAPSQTNPVHIPIYNLPSDPIRQYQRPSKTGNWGLEKNYHEDSTVLRCDAVPRGE
jgi:hypothetical protein